jgi:hypothetical protein
MRSILLPLGAWAGACGSVGVRCRIKEFYILKENGSQWETPVLQGRRSHQRCAPLACRAEHRTRGQPNMGELVWCPGAVGLPPWPNVNARSSDSMELQNSRTPRGACVQAHAQLKIVRCGATNTHRRGDTAGVGPRGAHPRPRESTSAPCCAAYALHRSTPPSYGMSNPP